MKYPLIYLILFSTIASAQAPLRLPAIISDHAVLQQSANVKLWGWGPGSNQIAIIGSWNKTDTVFAKVGADFTWETTIKTPKGGNESYEIAFLCKKQKLTVKDILLGEVWLCGGQSNMEYSFNWGGVSDVGDPQKAFTNNEQIRFFKVALSYYEKYPQSDCKGEWKVCNSTTAKDFSSVGYFFGKNLQEVLKAPVGLIGSYQGGTCIQTWCPKELFDDDIEQQRLNESEPINGWIPETPSLLYNSMIFPLAPYSLSGVIWYQGEGNIYNSYKTYSRVFSGMIMSWRKLFKTALPFYFVQIAPFSPRKGEKYFIAPNAALLREQQEATLNIPGTGMVNIGDLVLNDVNDIHPKTKGGVAKRLANLALKEVYNINNIQPYFPRFSSYMISKKRFIIKILSIGKLSCHEKEIKSFQIGGKDNVFHPARAIIDKDGNIVVDSKEEPEPVSVRYCFTNDQIPNLFDVNGLPLLPFRTDKW